MVGILADAISLGQITTRLTFVWSNAPLGVYALTAVATMLTRTATYVSRVGERRRRERPGLEFSMRVFAATQPGSNNLSAEGILDWAHWGLVGSNGFDQQGGCVGAAQQFHFDQRRVSREGHEYFRRRYHMEQRNANPERDEYEDRFVFHRLENGFR